MGRFYFMIFWIPAVASGLLLALARSNGLIGRPVLMLAWFVLALSLQIWGALFSPVWAIGLVLQTILAISLSIRLQLG